MRKQIHPFYSKASFDLTDPILQPKTEAMKIESSPNLINFTVHKNEIDDQLSDSLPVNDDDDDDDYVQSNNNEEDGSDDEYQGLEMETGLVDRGLNYLCPITSLDFNYVRPCLDLLQFNFNFMTRVFFNLN